MGVYLTGAEVPRGLATPDRGLGSSPGKAGVSFPSSRVKEVKSARFLPQAPWDCAAFVRANQACPGALGWRRKEPGGGEEGLGGWAGGSLSAPGLPNWNDCLKGLSFPLFACCSHPLAVFLMFG